MSLIANTARLLRPLLESPVIRRVRRNHGLEHATIHILNRQKYVLSGRSSAGGYVLFGDVPTDKVEAAAHEALNRMKRGQAGLAIHPNCGTNLVTTGLLTTLLAAFAFTNTDRRRAWDRFPVVMAGMMGIILYSQPLGMTLQKHITTSGDLGQMEIVSINRSEMQLPFSNQKTVIHHVLTRNG